MSQIQSKVDQLGEHFSWFCLSGTHIFLLLTFIQFAHMITSRNHFTKQTWPVCWVYSFYRLDPLHDGGTSLHCAAHAHTTHLTLLCSCRFSWRINTWSACDHETEQEFAQELSRFLSKTHKYSVKSTKVQCLTALKTNCVMNFERVKSMLIGINLTHRVVSKRNHSHFHTRDVQWLHQCSGA